MFYGPFFILDTALAIKLSIRTLGLNALVFYANTYWLLPRYIGRNTYSKYVLGVAVLVVFSGAVYNYTDTWVREARRDFGGKIEHKQENGHDITARGEENVILEKMEPLPPNRHRHLENKLFFRSRSFITGLFSSLGMLFISTLLWLIVESKQRKQRELSLVNQNLINEMKFLKTQMNPHFLFNALNNIYSLAYSHSVKTPEMVLKLSEMLRYVLYDSEEVKVSLGKEIDYIKNFVEFQRIKFEGIPNLHIDIERIDRQIMLEPMLLIPFVENSFKHSKIEDVDHGWISMVLTVEGEDLLFIVENSIPLLESSKGSMSGIGIDNVKRRLNYLYPNNHQLVIDSDRKKYRVKLKIKL
jgi:LytS/YehU family sensor histidine kinase